MICGGYYTCKRDDDVAVVAIAEVRLEACVIGDVTTVAEATHQVLAFARTRYPEKDGWQDHECRLAILNDVTVFKECERRRGRSQ